MWSVLGLCAIEIGTNVGQAFNASSLTPQCMLLNTILLNVILQKKSLQGKTMHLRRLFNVWVSGVLMPSETGGCSCAQFPCTVAFYVQYLRSYSKMKVDFRGRNITCDWGVLLCVHQFILDSISENCTYKSGMRHKHLDIATLYLLMGKVQQSDSFTLRQKNIFTIKRNFIY